MIILIRKNEMADEVLDVKFEPLQGRYQHLLYQSPNQQKQSISNDQCSNGSNLTKGFNLLNLTYKTKIQIKLPLP